MVRLHFLISNLNKASKRNNWRHVSRDLRTNEAAQCRSHLHGRISSRTKEDRIGFRGKATLNVGQSFRWTSVLSLLHKYFGASSCIIFFCRTYLPLLALNHCTANRPYAPLPAVALRTGVLHPIHQYLSHRTSIHAGYYDHWSERFRYK